jgi:hypothetical protein
MVQGPQSSVGRLSAAILGRRLSSRERLSYAPHRNNGTTTTSGCLLPPWSPTSPLQPSISNGLAGWGGGVGGLWRGMP